MRVTRREKIAIDRLLSFSIATIESGIESGQLSEDSLDVLESIVTLSNSSQNLRSKALELVENALNRFFKDLFAFRFLSRLKHTIVEVTEP